VVRLDGNLEPSTLLVPQLWQDISEILDDEWRSEATKS
jgi:hypothetical protein